MSLRGHKLLLLWKEKPMGEDIQRQKSGYLEATRLFQNEKSPIKNTSLIQVQG